MCERYALPDQLAAEREFAPARIWWKFATRYNVAGGQYLPAIRLHDGASEAVMMRWGLIPSWAEGEAKGAPAVSVESDGLEHSLVHRGAWLAGQRCIVPVAGFYAWQLTSAKYRQPYFVHLIDRSVFGLGGVWDRSVSAEDDVIESVALISVPANELVSGIGGPVRGMPSILRRRDYASWLQGDSRTARAALQPYPAKWMRAYAVSPLVNSIVVDHPAMIRAVG